MFLAFCSYGNLRLFPRIFKVVSQIKQSKFFVRPITRRKV